MKQFKDNKGRTWEINLSLAAARRIEGVDFSELTDQTISIINMHKHDCMHIMVSDASVMFGCIWACVQSQAEAIDCDEEDFLESVNGIVIMEAREAWVSELSDFFPEIKTALLKLLDGQKQASKKAEKRMGKLADKVIDQMGQEMDKRLSEAEKEANDQITGLTSG